MSKQRSVLGRLTEAQYLLLKARIEDEPHMTIQKLVNATVNAYIRGDFVIHPDGSYSVDSPSTIYEGEDHEALDLDEITGDPLDGEEAQTWGTRQLSEYAERVTGRRVSIELLRILCREKYPQELQKGQRYTWSTDDPTVRAIVEDIRDGGLENIKERRAKEFGGWGSSAAPKK